MVGMAVDAAREIGFIQWELCTCADERMDRLVGVRVGFRDFGNWGDCLVYCTCRIVEIVKREKIN